MKKNQFKSVIVFAAAVLTVAVSSCKSGDVAKVEEDEVLIQQYCSGADYFSTDEFIRANSVGESTDQSLSKRKARTNTLEELSSKINTTIKAVIDNYYKSTTTAVGEDIEQRYEGLTREVINQKISGYKTICEKVTKSSSKNTYKTYLAFELPVENILTPFYDRLSSDDKLRIDYDYEKFKKTFQEEMENFENR